MNIRYDDIRLPKKVSDILELDFWILQHVSPIMVRSVHNPVKFSAYTSIFVHSGSCNADINLLSHKIVGPSIVNVAANDIVFPRNVSDDFEASFMVLSKKLTEGITALIKDAGFFSMLRSHPVISLNESGAEVLKNFYNNLLSIAADKEIKYPFETVLFTIAAFFYRHAMKNYHDFIIPEAKGINNRIVDKFIHLVQQHFRKERFLDFYADQLDITAKHLSRTVKRQTGISPVDWITRYVILEAKVMLRSSNLNIQQIAEELNFPSQSIFGKYFKKATGLSPKEFRNSL